MGPGRRQALLWSIALGLVLTACSETEEVFVATGTLRVNIGDSSHEFQTVFVDPGDPLPLQFLKLTISEARVDVEGVGTFDFLNEVPCVLTQRLDHVRLPGLVILSEADDCLADGFVLSPVESGGAAVHLEITEIELRRGGMVEGNEPDLDGDGVDDATDNCPLIPNGLCTDCSVSLAECDQDGDGTVSEEEELDCNQADTDGEGLGDACFLRDDDLELTSFADQDGDGVPDVVDNCVRYPNEDQTDEKGTNAIGDACEETAQLLGSFVPTNLQTTGTFSVRAGAVNLLSVDLAGGYENCTWGATEADTPEPPGTCTPNPDAPELAE